MEEEQSPVSEEEGEDIMENLEKDYNQIPELDRYEVDGIDEKQYSDMDEEERRDAEAKMRERDHMEQAEKRRIPGAIQQIGESDEDYEMQINKMNYRRQMQYREIGEDEEDEEGEDERHLDIEQAKGKLRTWIKEPRTVRWIRKKFRRFILVFKNEKKQLIYSEKLKEMCDLNQQSLEINYIDLSKAETVLAYWIADEPSIIIPYLNQVAFEIA